jgi:hypothetical protein
MARNAAVIPGGARVTDHISLGVLTSRIPTVAIHRVLNKTGRQSQRERKLPMHVTVYYVVALALYMEASYNEVMRVLLEGLEWMGLPVKDHRTVAKSAISQARTRLGVEPVQRLYEELAQPIATEQTRGAWYAGRRIVSLDGSTLDVADTPENDAAFGRPRASRGKSGFPQICFVSLVENGTHVLYGARWGSYDTSEIALAREVLKELRPGVLCIADRHYFGYGLWKQACATGADLIWRVKKNLILPCIRRLEDGSYISRIYPSPRRRARDEDGIDVRVVEYRLEGTEKEEEVYRLVTTLLDPDEAPAAEIAALYHERWEIENAFDELKTHLRGRNIVLRSRTPELVKQEFYGFLLAHYAVRGLMHEAALKADVDPDELSFVHSVRVVKRKLPRFVSLPPCGTKRAS